MKRIALLAVALLLLTGCYAPLPKPTPEPDGHSDEAVIEPREGVSVSVALPVGAWDWVATNLKGNTLTIRDAITIKDASGVAVTIAAGASATIEVATDQALVTFSKPWPNAKKLGINADIKSLILKPDGTGTAQTAKFGAWGFRWIDDGSKSAPGCVCGCSRADCRCSSDTPQAAASKPTKPIVTAYLPPWCGSCGPVKADLLRDGKPRTDLPFEVILKTSDEDLAADGVQSVPLVRWSSADGKSRYRYDGFTGWPGLDSMIKEWAKDHQVAEGVK